MNNILVTGAKGQLGSELKFISMEYQEYNFFWADRNSLDITDHSLIKKFIEENSISVIINCAAYTKVDRAEEKHEICDALNHLAVGNLAEISKENGISLLHISTDYVFDGRAEVPYSELEKTNPLNTYGETKLAGEIAIKKINPRNSIIIRTSWLYSSYGSNFVTTMLRLGKEKKELNVVSDQFGTPTYARDLAKLILKIIPGINNDEVEVYHYSNEGSCTWYDFSKEIFNLKKKSIKVYPVLSSEYRSSIQRPMYSVLDKNKIKEKFNIEIPYWKDSLEKCLQEISQNNLN